jgi:hypothetical protein
MAAPRRPSWVFLPILLASLAGCQGLHQAAAPPPVPMSGVSVAAAPSSPNADTAAGKIAEAQSPAFAEQEKPAGGLLLKIGGLFMGPAVGRNLYRIQGDGEWGF